MDAFDQLLAEHPELADLTSPADVLPPSGYRYFSPPSSFRADPYARVEPPERCEIEFPRVLLTDEELYNLRAQVGQHIHVRTEGPSGPAHHNGVLLAVERCERGCHIRLTLRPDGSPPWR